MNPYWISQWYILHIWFQHCEAIGFCSKLSLFKFQFALFLWWFPFLHPLKLAFLHILIYLNCSYSVLLPRIPDSSMIFSVYILRFYYLWKILTFRKYIVMRLPLYYHNEQCDQLRQMPCALPLCDEHTLLKVPNLCRPQICLTFLLFNSLWY